MEGRPEMEYLTLDCFSARLSDHFPWELPLYVLGRVDARQVTLFCHVYLCGTLTNANILLFSPVCISSTRRTTMRETERGAHRANAVLREAREER